MSNLNDFTNPQLQLTKSNSINALGVLDSINQVILELDTVYVRIHTLEAETPHRYTLTLDGTTPNLANTDAIQIYQNEYIFSGSGSGSARASAKDNIIFESKVIGGATLKICSSGSGDPFIWEDMDSGSKKLLIQQYSY